MAVDYEEWMSDSDALMWNIERDPVLRSTITSVWVLDQAPDLDRFDASLDRALGRIPRLRQRVVADGMGVATPRWETDPLFDRGYHVRRVGCPGEGTLQDLLGYAGPLAGQAFDKDRPLWELHQVDGLEGGRVGIIMRLHHTVSDGVGMVRMTGSLMERAREADPARDQRARDRFAQQLAHEEEAHRSGDMEQLASAVQQRFRTAADRSRRVSESLGRGLLEAAKGPRALAERVSETAKSVGRLVRPVSEPLSPIWRDRSFSVDLNALAVPFDALRAAAKSVDGSLNDSFVAAIAGGLRHYHEAHGFAPDELRMTMPINMRSDDETGDKAGNQFVPARFEIPVGIVDPKERMSEIRARVRAQRDEPALPFMDEVSSVINRAGALGATSIVSGMMKSVDFVTSNVPGPSFPVYFGGARIDHMFGFGPLSGAAVNVTLFSYDGQLQLGISSDRLAVPDPGLLLASLQEGIDEVTSVA